MTDSIEMIFRRIVRDEVERASAPATPPAPTGPEPWLNEKQVSEHTGIPVGTLQYWRRGGEAKVLPFHRVGRRVLYRLSEVDAAIERMRVAQ